MAKKKKQKQILEFRCYTLPAGRPFIALLGQDWIRAYGEGIDCLHFHNYMEIGYCYEGQGNLILGEESFRFTGAQFSVIPQNFPHTTNSDEGTKSRWEYLFIDVSTVIKEFYEEATTIWKERIITDLNSRAIFRYASESPLIADLIVKLLDIMRERKELHKEEAKGLLAALLIALAQDYRESQADGQENIRRSTMGGERSMSLISNAVDYIANHYQEPIRISDLAEGCHVSETHFRRMFSAYMEMSPLEYLNLVRIQAAAEYLKKTDRQISDIAGSCGFSTPSTFNRNFKQVMGLSPHEWRQRPENFEQKLLQFEIHNEEGWQTYERSV